MMTNKGNYLAAADHELDCDVLQVGDDSDHILSTRIFRQTRRHLCAAFIMMLTFLLSAPVHRKH